VPDAIHVAIANHNGLAAFAFAWRVLAERQRGRLPKHDARVREIRGENAVPLGERPERGDDARERVTESEMAG
jgi:hypothetical protein